MMQTPATSTGSEQVLEISQNHILSDVSQSSLLWVLDKERTWKEPSEDELRRFSTVFAVDQTGHTNRHGTSSKSEAYGYCTVRDVVSSFLKARSLSASSQTHTHRNKRKWGVAECKPGGDETNPQGLTPHRAVYHGLVF